MLADPNRVLKLRVPVIVRLGGRVMSIGDVVALVPGSIIELPKNAEDELELLVNNKIIGAGTAVKVAENFGLRITRIGTARTRAAAVASSPSGGPASGDDLKDLADRMLSSQA